jgi:hypothetical protein
MNRKDIALSVAGVLATMALAYLFYRQERADAAAAAAPAVQDVSDPSYADYADPNYAYQYAGSAAAAIPTVSVPSYTADSVDTSASTATASQTPTDDDNLLSQILAAYHGDTTASTVNSSLAIPAATVQPALTVTNVPQTAADALTNSQNMLGVSGVTGGAVNPPSTTAVHFNHIVNQGS